MTYKTLDEIKNIVRAFEDCTLPRSEWTHHAHLTIALWYLTHFSPARGDKLFARSHNNIQRCSWYKNYKR